MRAFRIFLLIREDVIFIPMLICPNSFHVFIDVAFHSDFLEFSDLDLFVFYFLRGADSEALVGRNRSIECDIGILK